MLFLRNDCCCYPFEQKIQFMQPMFSLITLWSSVDKSSAFSWKIFEVKVDIDAHDVGRYTVTHIVEVVLEG